MASGSQAAVLQELFDCLCQETDQKKIYKILKEMSTVPILCDKLAEIGFRETIKRLKKQHLLVQFVQDLVAKWSPVFPEAPQDLGLEKSLTRDYQSNSPEKKSHEPTSQETQGAGREGFFGLSSCSPGKISRLNSSQTSHIRSDPWEPNSRSQDIGVKWSPKQQLAGQNVVQVGMTLVSLKEPWQHDVAKPFSRGPWASTGDNKWLVFWGTERASQQATGSRRKCSGAGSLWVCLNVD